MLICAVDVGTTGTKTMIINEYGNKLAYAYEPYSLTTTADGKIEQNANDWWKATTSSIKACIVQLSCQEQISVISISAQGGSLVFTDKEGNPLDYSISWMDSSRGLPFIKPLLEWKSVDWFYKMSGWKLSPSMSAAKILWVKKNKPELLNPGNRIFSTIDFLNYKFTSQFVIDPSSASMTQLFDFRNKAWNISLLSYLGIDQSMLPKIVPTGQIIGELTPASLNECGLQDKVHLICGGHDQYCAAIGSGSIHSGDVMLSTGTAWVSLGIDQHISFDFNGYPGIGNHIVDQMMGRMSTVSTGGVSLEWARGKLFSSSLDNGDIHKISYENLETELVKRIKNASELIFYPHFQGMGYPTWNHSAKASLMGLTLDHDKHDITLAIMEGVVFQVAYGLTYDQKLGFSPQNINLLGGASRSRLWKNIIVSVLDIPVTVFSEADLACYGVAIIASYSLGLIQSYEHGVKTMVKSYSLSPPDTQWREHYLKKFDCFIKGYKSINDFYSDSGG